MLNYVMFRVYTGRTVDQLCDVKNMDDADKDSIADHHDASWISFE